MNDLLLRLRDKGNTVLVVEHEPETIAIADHVVDLGPGAGTAGGTVCFEGPVEGLRANGTLTGRHLDDRAALKETVRTPTGTLEIRGATANNLRDVDVDLPLGVLVVVTGVAGSGKSSLVRGSIPAGAGVVSIDQGAIRGSRRSNPATYTGLLDPIRKAFAKANGVKPALFSANSQGACPNCNGIGVVYTDLAMMAGVATPCEECGESGSRHRCWTTTSAAATSARCSRCRSPRPRRSSAPARRARRPPRHPRPARRRRARLPQPRPAAHHAVRRRAAAARLATRMAEQGGVYVLDEPTTGLHLADVEQLLGLLDRLVDAGTSVIVVEHHQAVMAHADWIIDLGPGAGHDGGRVVFEGTPPTSSPPAPPSPASTSPPTSAPDRDLADTMRRALSPGSTQLTGNGAWPTGSSRPLALRRLIPSAYRPMLVNRVFRRLILGFAVSYLGDGMSFVAVAWLAIELAPPATAGLWVGGAVAAYTMPGVVGALVFGRRLRQVPARRLLLADNVVRGVVLGAVPLAWLAGLLTSPRYVVLLAVSSLLHAWGSAGKYTLLAELLPDE